MGVSVTPGRPARIRRSDSFRFACRGLAVLLKTQANARIHAAATALIVTAGWWFRIDRTDWILITLAAGAVWAAEGLNTAIEFLTDRVSPEWSSEAARVKDVAAAAVLLSALAALITGCLVFGPPVLQWLSTTR